MSAPDSHAALSITPDEVRVTIPVYLVASLSARRVSPAKITIRSTDPILLKELQTLYNEAKANPGTKGSIEAFSRLPPRNWQILSIESSLKPMKVPDRPMPGQKGGPGR